MEQEKTNGKEEHVFPSPAALTEPWGWGGEGGAEEDTRAPNTDSSGRSEANPITNGSPRMKTVPPQPTPHILPVREMTPNVT